MISQPIWTDQRRTADGRYRIARERIRHITIWKVLDLTKPFSYSYSSEQILSQHRTLAEARKAVEALY